MGNGSKWKVSNAVFFLTSMPLAKARTFRCVIDPMAATKSGAVPLQGRDASHARPSVRPSRHLQLCGSSTASPGPQHVGRPSSRLVGPRPNCSLGSLTCEDRLCTSAWTAYFFLGDAGGRRKTENPEASIISRFGATSPARVGGAWGRRDARRSPERRLDQRLPDCRLGRSASLLLKDNNRVSSKKAPTSRRPLIVQPGPSGPARSERSVDDADLLGPFTPRLARRTPTVSGPCTSARLSHGQR